MATSITITSGEDKRWSVALTDDSGAAINLTGALAIRVAAYSRYPVSAADDSSAAFIAEIGDGITPIDPIAGVVELYLASSKTAGLRSAEIYRLGWSITTAAGERIFIGAQTLTVRPRIPVSLS